MFNDILDSILTVAETTPGLFSTITSGSIPGQNGIAAYLGPSSPRDHYFNRSKTYDVIVVFNAKHADQSIALDALSEISRTLDHADVFPAGDVWEIETIDTKLAPSLTGQDNDNQWIYTMTVSALVTTN